MRGRESLHLRAFAPCQEAAGLQVPVGIASLPRHPTQYPAPGAADPPRAPWGPSVPVWLGGTEAQLQHGPA